jgi:hypothetical protein
MKPEKPAVGILKQGEFGDSVWYLVPCDCSDPDHSHTIEVEADETFSVNVHIYDRMITPFWSKSRWRQIWDILSKGYTEYESTIILKEQQAINYADALVNAANDVKLFKAKQVAAKEKK